MICVPATVHVDIGCSFLPPTRHSPRLTPLSYTGDGKEQRRIPGVFANLAILGILSSTLPRGGPTNAPWERLQPLLPPQKPTTGRPAVDHRRILNGIVL